MGGAARRHVQPLAGVLLCVLDHLAEVVFAVEVLPVPGLQRFFRHGDYLGDVAPAVREIHPRILSDHEVHRRIAYPNLEMTLALFIRRPLPLSFADRHGVAFAFEETSDLRLARLRQPHPPFHLYLQDTLLLALDLDESPEHCQAFRHLLSRLELPGGVRVQRPDLADEPLFIPRVGQRAPELELLPRVHLRNGFRVRPRVGRFHLLPIYRLNLLKPEGYVFASPGAVRQETVGFVILRREHPHRFREIVRRIDGRLRGGGFLFLTWLRCRIRILSTRHSDHEHDNDEDNPYV